MSPEQIAFAERYRLFLQLMGFFAWILPKVAYPALIRSLGRWANPYVLRASVIKKVLSDRFTPEIARRTWLAWLDSHARFTLDFFCYGQLDENWLRNDVDIENPQLLETLRQSGGFLLTYHSHHQNTLCCALGLSGCEVSAIASAPQDSPMFSYFGRWAQRVNVQSEKHFRGGRYLFVNDKRLLARSIRECLNDKKVLVSLCDFHEPATNKPVWQMMGHAISPPTGAIDIALKIGVPIYAAMFAPWKGRLRLQVVRLEAEGGSSTTIRGYLDFLELCVTANPCCWQGWDWFNDLALPDNPLQ
jgi:hypothetical protein